MWIEKLKISHVSNAIYLSEFSVRFTFWGLMSILVIFLPSELHFSEYETYLIFGSFGALGFMGSIFGGWIADKLSNFFAVMLIGLAMILIGLISLLDHFQFLYLSLSLIGCGIGLFNPAAASLLGSLDNNSLGHEKKFTYLYVAKNLGGLLGPIFFGIFITYSMLKLMLLINILILAISIFLSLGLKKQGNFTNNKNSNLLYAWLLILILPIGMAFFMQYHFLAGYILFVLFIATVFYIYFSIRGLEKKIIINTLNIILKILLMLVFFAFSLQTNGSLITFINNYINTSLFGWIVPSSSFASLEPAFVILASPLVLLLWQPIEKRISEFSKQGLGLFFLGIGFFIFSDISKLFIMYHHKISIAPIFLGMFFIGLGEILIMPPLMSAIANRAPQKIKGTLMGLMYLSLSFSAYFSGLLSELTNVHTASNTLDFYHTYANVAKISIIIGAAIFLIAFTFNQRGLNLKKTLS